MPTTVVVFFFLALSELDPSGTKYRGRTFLVKRSGRSITKDLPSGIHAISSCTVGSANSECRRMGNIDFESLRVVVGTCAF